MLIISPLLMIKQEMGSILFSCGWVRMGEDPRRDGVKVGEQWGGKNKLVDGREACEDLCW